jgi:hypothetical protein
VPLLPPIIVDDKVTNKVVGKACAGAAYRKEVQAVAASLPWQEGGMFVINSDVSKKASPPGSDTVISVLVNIDAGF